MKRSGMHCTMTNGLQARFYRVLLARVCLVVLDALFAVAHQVSFRRVNLKALDLKAFRSVCLQNGVFPPILRASEWLTWPPSACLSRGWSHRACPIHTEAVSRRKRLWRPQGENIIFSLRCWGTVPEYLESFRDVVAPSAAFASDSGDL